MIQQYTKQINEKLSTLLNEHGIDCFNTNGEVLDWLYNEYQIAVEFIPVFTYALINHIGYGYKVYQINKDDAGLKLLFDDEGWFSSFPLAVEEIIKKLIEETYIV